MNGFLYIATGSQFVRESLVSARSLREQMPEASIGIICDEPPGDEDLFDHVIEIEDPEYSFSDQLRYMNKTPYDRTIVIDTDLYFVGDVTDLFDLLDRFEIAAAHNQNPGAYDPPGVPEAFPEYNTGLIAYRSDSTAQFLNSWWECYRELVRDEKPQNQPSFRKALYESDLRVATLPREYNAMVRVPGHVTKPVKVCHGRLLDIETPGAGQFNDIREAAKKLDEQEGHRVWTQAGGFTVHTNRDSKIGYLKMGLERYGIRGVISRAISRFRP